jgi:hypothetical protein
MLKSGAAAEVVAQVAVMLILLHLQVVEAVAVLQAFSRPFKLQTLPLLFL